MDGSTAESLIRDYFEAWKAADAKRFLGLLSEDATVCASDGTVYESVGKAEEWFHAFFDKGNRVHAWEITDFFFDETAEQAAAVWYLRCGPDGGEKELYGCSVVQFKLDRIYKIREFRMDEERKSFLP